MGSYLIAFKRLLLDMAAAWQGRPTIMGNFMLFVAILILKVPIFITHSINIGANISILNVNHNCLALKSDWLFIIVMLANLEISRARFL